MLTILTQEAIRVLRYIYYRDAAYLVLLILPIALSGMFLSSFPCWSAEG